MTIHTNYLNQSLLKCQPFAIQKSAKPDSIAFRPKRFKILHVAYETVSSTILSVYHFAIAIVCKLFFKKVELKKHITISSYYISKAYRRFHTYIYFKDRVLNFTSNNIGPNFHLPTVNSDPISNLKNQFGEKFVDLLELNKKHKELDENKMKIKNSGFCLGVSIDILSKYHEMIRKNITCDKAIEIITTQYKDKVTDHAQIFQYLYYSISFHCDIDHPNSREELISFAQAFQKTIPITSILSPLKFEPVFGYVCNPQKEKIPDKETIDFFEHLDAGAYLLCSLRSEKKPGHAMVYIKDSKNNGYFIDSNYGAIDIGQERHCETIYKHIHQNYYKKDNYSLIIGFSCKS